LHGLAKNLGTTGHGVSFHRVGQRGVVMQGAWGAKELSGLVYQLRCPGRPLRQTIDCYSFHPESPNAPVLGAFFF
jgi:hypothetical protein